MTNSVGLLSDALESLVNMIAAIIALVALNVAARPADEEFAFGYTKVEFFSSGFEGGMILIAAGSIIAAALPRLIDPQPLEQVGLGLGISVLASLINLVTARVLGSAALRYGSITLEADAHHPMTDVLTTGGVVVGVSLVSLTGLEILDPLIALLVAANILVTGIRLIRRSVRGLMDAALPDDDVEKIEEALRLFEAQGIVIHALRTRTAAARGFVSMHVLVPGSWSVKRAHDTAVQIEATIQEKLPRIGVFTHVEPLDDPASWQDNDEMPR